MDAARVVLTGGRSFDDAGQVAELLSALVLGLRGRPVLLAEGGCRTGLDALVRDWARRCPPVLGVSSITFQADWNTYGIAAGPKRNRQMLDTVKPHLVFCFNGGRGTRDCISAAIQRKLPVYEVPSLKQVTKVYEL